MDPAADTLIKNHAVFIRSVADLILDDCKRSECVIVMVPRRRLSPAEKCLRPSEAELNRCESRCAV
jgi:hypothetical protein